MSLPPAKKVPAAKVLAVARELDTQDLEAVIHDLLTLRAQRSGPSLPREEALLFDKINRGLAPDKLQRFEILQHKRETETMSDREQTELIALTEEVEKLDVQRVKYLSKLAQLRKVSLRELMAQIGLRNKLHG
jgi:hypothetical protein